MTQSQLETTAPIRALRAAEVDHWDDEHDVVVVGFGGAGAGAAIEAVRAGADTVVLERMTRGGGTTALCTGVVTLPRFSGQVDCVL